MVKEQWMFNFRFFWSGQPSWPRIVFAENSGRLFRLKATPWLGKLPHLAWRIFQNIRFCHRQCVCKFAAASDHRPPKPDMANTILIDGHMNLGVTSFSALLYWKSSDHHWNWFHIPPVWTNPRNPNVVPLNQNRSRLTRPCMIPNRGRHILHSFVPTQPICRIFGI